MQELMLVKSQKMIAHQIFELKLTGELVSRMLVPGQFLHLLVPRADLLLRRPISICSVDPEINECTLIYRVEGAGTRVLSELKPGDKIDALGPLGNGYPVDQADGRADSPAGLAVLIGGGIGVPPLYELAKQLRGAGFEVRAFLGFATQSAVFYEDEFRQFANVTISTDDGSYGFAGNALEALEEAGVSPDAVYACGAPGMLRAVDEIFREHKAAFISLESRMACGVGACYACVCHVRGDDSKQLSRKVCDQGPVFKTGEVLF